MLCSHVVEIKGIVGSQNTCICWKLLPQVNFNRLLNGSKLSPCSAYLFSPGMNTYQRFQSLIILLGLLGARLKRTIVSKFGCLVTLCLQWY